jgi:translocation and assembly module TamB
MLLSAVSAEEPRSLRLDEPVLLSIADGRVNQRGLAIPIAGLTKLEIEGWVDFDRNMNLVATLPFTRELFGGQTVASNLLAGARVKLLITGTLGNPKLDKETLRKNIGELRDTLLTNVAGNGAVEILRLLSKPRDPNAPPPPTAEERKAKRLEMRNERRKARGLDPLPQPPAKP